MNKSKKIKRNIKIKKNKCLLTRCGGSNNLRSNLELNNELVSDSKAVYKLKDYLARGTFGIIWEVKNEYDGKYYALKEIIDRKGIKDEFCYPNSEFEIIKIIFDEQKKGNLINLIKIIDIGPFTKKVDKEPIDNVLKILKKKI